MPEPSPEGVRGSQEAGFTQPNRRLLFHVCLYYEVMPLPYLDEVKMTRLCMHHSLARRERGPSFIHSPPQVATAQGRQSLRPRIARPSPPLTLQSVPYPPQRWLTSPGSGKFCRRGRDVASWQVVSQSGPGPVGKLEKAPSPSLSSFPASSLSHVSTKAFILFLLNEAKHAHV